MRFFESFFGKNFRDPAKDKWDNIITSIHAGLEPVRPTFFVSCVNIVRITPGCPIQNSTMNPEIELKILVAQLMFARLIIADQQYIRPNDGDQFVTMMLSDALRYGPIVARNEIVTRYFKGNEEGIKKVVFFDDVARFIAGQEAPLAALAMEGSLTEMIQLFSWLSVAISFGDNATVRKIEKCLESRNSK